jgi:hypothetical protein
MKKKKYIELVERWNKYKGIVLKISRHNEQTKQQDTIIIGGKENANT